MMTLYGLIGYPLGHSFSATFFNEMFEREGIDSHYENFPMRDVESLREFIASTPHLRGLNVTSPHKMAVAAIVDELCGDAIATGAVNTVKICADGRLEGHNTDVGGFRYTVEAIVKERGIRRALVLGTGGASKAVVLALSQLGVAAVTVSRMPKEGAITYADIDAGLMESVGMIVNATPVGMGEMEGEAPPIDYSLVGPQHFCYDLIYNPAQTEFLRRCEERGAATTNGHRMLLSQALRSYAIWQSE